MRPIEKLEKSSPKFVQKSNNQVDENVRLGTGSPAKIKRTRAILAALATLAIASIVPATAKTPNIADKQAVDAAAIQSTIVEFVQAMDKNDLQAAASHVQNPGKAFHLLMLQSDCDLHKIPDMWSNTTVVSVQSTPHGDDATAKVTFKRSAAKKNGTSIVHLHRRAAKWLIVSPKIGQNIDLNDPLSWMALSEANPMVAVGARQAGRTEACRSELKQLTLAVLQYLLDSDAFPTDLSHFDTDLEPYMPRRIPFTCVEDATIRYHLNSRLAGKSNTDVRAVPNVVLLYEGANDQMAFPHDFKGFVAFTSGEVKLIGPADAARLVWDPSGIAPNQSRLPGRQPHRQLAGNQ